MKFTLAEKNQKIVNEMEKSKTRKSSPQTQKDKKKTKKEKPSRSAEHIQPGMNELVERTSSTLKIVKLIYLRAKLMS